jgi:hypothetical protein
MSVRNPGSFTELIFLYREWQDSDEPPPFAILMASLEVDQKYLGNFARRTSDENPFLSGMLFKLLGLSIILSKKLVRARKTRRLDPTRDTRSLQRYLHILWLSREGLVMVEQYVLPMVADYIEMRVLANKLRASFYHIFVLFHNQPSIHSSGILNLPTSTSQINVSNGAAPTSNGLIRPSRRTDRDSITASPPPTATPEGGPVGGTHLRPPGLTPVPPPKTAASFILPAIDYTPTATACFSTAGLLADALLPGSHPIRLSVKLEYAAYLYDCLNDSDGCRRLAKQAIADVYRAKEGMDDDSFEDAAELVGILGKMVKRGGRTSSTGGSSTAGRERSRSEGSRSTPPRGTGGDQGGTPRQHQRQRTPTTRGTPTRGTYSAVLVPAVPGPGMTNLI